MKRKEKTTNKIVQYFREKMENINTSHLQQLLHLYFDFNSIPGILNSKEIAQVNQLLTHIMVIYPDELNNFKKFLNQMSSLNDGAKVYQEERDHIRRKLALGHIVSKDDACIAADRVIVLDPKMTVLKSNSNGDLVEYELHPEGTYALDVNPSAEQFITKVPYCEDMEKSIKLFRGVKRISKIME